MCASYGLDPRYADKGDLFAEDRDLRDALLAWAEGNDGRTLLPTGRNARNRTPIVVDDGGDRRLVPGWWGLLAEGATVRFSINTRSERLERQRVPLRGRAVARSSRRRPGSSCRSRSAGGTSSAREASSRWEPSRAPGGRPMARSTCAIRS